MAVFEALRLAAAVTLLSSCVSALSITAYGAVANDTSYEAAVKNGQALFEAAMAANALPATGSREVLVPAGEVFTMVPFAVIEGIQNVEFQLLGTLNAFPGDIGLWPNATDGHALNFIELRYTMNVSVTGGGTGLLQGNGYRWWWHVLLTGQDNRPRLFQTVSCIGTQLRSLRLENAPYYHINWGDALGGLIEGVTVYVDVDGQLDVLRHFGHTTFRGDIEIPTFPLNTDGIDISGRDVRITGCKVTNFDDAFCLKPMDGRGNLTQCTERILFENGDITWGVGASTGSVPPTRDVNCIRNSTFRNIAFHHPLKAIYVKPNPAPYPGDTEVSGVIDNIKYENIHIEGCLWWSIYVGTQQQEQPGNGTDTHCSFFYPLPGTTCPTWPQTPVTNLVLTNVTSVDSLMSQGLLRCNPAGPCTGWRWTDVSMSTLTRWPVGDGFMCEAIEGADWRNVDVGCVRNSTT